MKKMGYVILLQFFRSSALNVYWQGMVEKTHSIAKWGEIMGPTNEQTAKERMNEWGNEQTT